MTIIFIDTVDRLKALDRGALFSAQHATFPIKHDDGAVEYKQALYLVEAGLNEQGTNIGLGAELTEKIAKIWKRKFTEYLGGSFEGCLSIKTIVARIEKLEAFA